MNLKIVDKLPESKSHRNIRLVLEEFVHMNAKIVEIDPIKEGYKNPHSAQTAFSTSIRRYNYKNSIIARTCGDKLYLIKTTGGTEL